MTDLKSSSGWRGLRKTANASSAPLLPHPLPHPHPRRPLACPRLRGEGRRGRHTETPVRAELRISIPQSDRKLMRASWSQWERRQKGGKSGSESRMEKGKNFTGFSKEQQMRGGNDFAGLRKERRRERKDTISFAKERRREKGYDPTRTLPTEENGNGPTCRLSLPSHPFRPPSPHSLVLLPPPPPPPPAPPIVTDALGDAGTTVSAWKGPRAARNSFPFVVRRRRRREGKRGRRKKRGRDAGKRASQREIDGGARGAIGPLPLL